MLLREKPLLKSIEGMLILNEHNQVTWWNQVACDFLQVDVARYKNRSMIEVLDETEFGRLSTENILVKEMAKGQVIALRLYPFMGEQKIVMMQDITRDHNLDKMRRDFIANASHELRTPLTVFRGYLDIIKNQPKVTEPQLLKIIKDMSGQAERMERMVEDLLLLSHLESDDPNLKNHQPVMVSSLLRDVCSDAQTISAGKHQFVIELNENLELMGSADELASAFSNLIYNAVQYTQEEGVITIRWFKDQAGVCMQVQDTGIGIDKKYLDRITQRFYRVDKSRSYRGIGGTGLGLAIVKHVLLRHQGHLVIESELGVGSVFSCRFQVQTASIRPESMP